jgi:hypothetical protein
VSDPNDCFQRTIATILYVGIVVMFIRAADWRWFGR